MSYESRFPSAANLVGNVAIPRNIYPVIRSRIRRNDPDFSSSTPYYPNAAGKTLRIDYTKEVATVVTPISVDVALTGNGIATVLADINAADATNIHASDLDGFLTIQNLNPGKTHYLRFAPFDTPADDAAFIFGFAVDPFPGSTSFAGEVAASPGSRTQLNPQTTTLLAQNDALRSGEINRPLYSILQMLENLRAELTRDVVVYKSVHLNFSSHNPGPVAAARINDDSLRIFYPFPESEPPVALNPKDLAPYYHVLENTGAGEAVRNFGVGTTDANAMVVTNLYYATNVTNFDGTAVFSTWGTPDGKTIISSTVPNKDKHASTTVTDILGNIVHCASATFVTKKVKAGDPVKLTAAVLQPFDHSGWFAVDAVIDETHIAVRPMASTEEVPDGTTIKPRWLNPAAAGTLRVAVGRFIPAGDIYITVNSPTLTPELVIRVPVGVPFISTINEDRARALSGNLTVFGAVLQNHIDATLADRHPATSITGFTSATSWRDSTTITGTNIKQTIEDILTDLKAQATGDSGTGRIGAEVISIGGGTPNTLAQGTVLTQLTSLLTSIRDHINQSSGAHAATAISYGGGAAWADGTTNPSTTVEAQLDKILVDLGGTGGASKIKYDGGANWADGTTNPAATVEDQLDKILTDLGGTGGASKIKYDGGVAWADGTTNPATNVETQLDKILSDLAPSTGSAKIGGAATGSDISAGTLAAQIADLAVNWLKMSRANTIGGAQTFSALLTSAAITASGLITANAGLTAGANQHITVSGTGLFKHGSISIIIGVPSTRADVPGGGDNGPAINTPPISWNFISAGTTSATAGKIHYPITLPVGARILSWSLNANKQSNGSCTITAKLFRVSAALTQTQIGVDQTNSANAPAFITLGQSGLTETIASEQYRVEVGSPSSSTANGVDSVMHLVVTYDRP